MKKIISLVFLALLLSGCQILSPHRIPIEQGNIITEENAGRLHLGMGEGEVRSVMGNPLYINVFSSSRTVYVYTYRPSYGNMTVTRLICVFQNGRLKSIEHN